MKSKFLKIAAKQSATHYKTPGKKLQKSLRRNQYKSLQESKHARSVLQSTPIQDISYAGYSKSSFREQASSNHHWGYSETMCLPLIGDPTCLQ